MLRVEAELLYIQSQTNNSTVPSSTVSSSMFRSGAGGSDESGEGSVSRETSPPARGVCETLDHDAVMRYGSTIDTVA